MPGGGRGRVPQTKVTISLPSVLVERVEQHIKKRGDATSVADFLRQSAAREIDRLEDAERVKAADGRK